MQPSEIMAALGHALKATLSAFSHLNTAADVIGAVTGVDIPTDADGKAKAIGALRGLFSSGNERKWLETCMDYEETHQGSLPIIAGYLRYAFPVGKTRDERMQRWWYMNSFMTHITNLSGPKYKKMFFDELVKFTNSSPGRPRVGYGKFLREYHIPNGIPYVPTDGSALSVAEIQRHARGMYKKTFDIIEDLAARAETRATQLKTENRGFLHSLSSIWD